MLPFLILLLATDWHQVKIQDPIDDSVTTRFILEGNYDSGRAEHPSLIVSCEKGKLNSLFVHTDGLIVDYEHGTGAERNQIGLWASIRIDTQKAEKTWAQVDRTSTNVVFPDNLKYIRRILNAQSLKVRFDLYPGGYETALFTIGDISAILSSCRL